MIRELLLKSIYFLAVAGGIFLLAINVNLFNLCIQQNKNIEFISNQQKAEAEFIKNQFSIQRQTIADFQKDLLDQKKELDLQKKQLDLLDKRLAGQGNLLTLEKEKRIYLESENKNIKELVGQKLGIISQSMKDWQKDFVGVIADVQNKTAASQGQIKDLSDKLDSINISEINYKLISLQATVDKMVLSNFPNPQNKIDEMMSSLRQNHPDY